MRLGFQRSVNAFGDAVESNGIPFGMWAKRDIG